MEFYVERLHRALADALRASRDQPFTQPVTVAEIYQDLVPYRSVRTEIGFEMNADYEHALLHLLAGEGERARLEPDEAARELRDELTSSNPNVGLFRKFAACDVWVMAPPPEAEAPAGTGVGAEVAGAEPAAAGSPATANGGAGSTSSRPASAAPAADDEDEDDDVLELHPHAVVDESASEAPAASSSRTEPAASSTGGTTRSAPHSAPHPVAALAGGGACGFCGGELPAGRPARFCPHCGADQSTRPCRQCGEKLEAGWQFCIACGASQE